MGDSRVVMVRCINAEWIKIDLTKDQKPDTPEEKERIIKRGGRVESYKDANGNNFDLKRVWLKNADRTIFEPVIEKFEIT